MKARYKQLF